MATRSTTILKAKTNGIIQGSSDDYWTNENWNDFYHEAIDMIHADVCDAGLPFYIVRDELINKDGDGLYPLHADCYAVLRVQNNSGNADIFAVREDEDDSGFVLENNSIRLMNWDGDVPATLKVLYRRFQPYLGDYSGATDAVTVVPLAPLNSERGNRLIARLMVIMAKTKDENLTPDEFKIISGLIQNFVDRLDGFNQTESPVISD